MDRPIVYVDALAADTDQLNLAKFAMVALAELSQAVFGAGTLLVGLAASPGSGLNVSIGAGAVYQMGAIDSTAFGSLGTNSNQVLKQGILLIGTTLSCPAPSASGKSINYLVQVQQEDVDSSSAVLEFYNSAAPTEPFAGPNNTGATSSTIRTSIANVQIKAGSAANTGSQATPTPDTGFVAAWVVTVAHGQTTIGSGNIAVAGSAPFLTETLLQKISAATADTLIADAIAPLALSADLAAETARAEVEEGDLATAITAEATRAEAAEALLAPLDSPELTGTPIAPTAAANDDSTKIATTAYADRAATAVKSVGNYSNSAGPWWTWDPNTGKVEVEGQYTAGISSEGPVAVSFPVNIGAFRTASAEIIQNSSTDATEAQIDSATPPTSTGMTVRIQDNQGGSTASATGFYWWVTGYSATQPA